MRCPFCGNIDTQVKDSRPAEDHVSIRRRRFCVACGGRFTTYERVQLRDLVVIKSSGSCLLYTSPSPRDYAASRMPSSA